MACWRCRQALGEVGKGRKAAKTGARRTSLEVLLVPDVRHGTLVLVAVAGGKGVLAAGHDVLGAYGELTAPRGPPGQSHAQAAPLTRQAGGVDDAANDVRAKTPHPGADGDRLGGPAIGDFGGDVV